MEIMGITYELTSETWKIMEFLTELTSESGEIIGNPHRPDVRNRGNHEKSLRTDVRNRENHGESSQN